MHPSEKVKAVSLIPTMPHTQVVFFYIIELFNRSVSRQSSLACRLAIRIAFRMGTDRLLARTLSGGRASRLTALDRFSVGYGEAVQRASPSFGVCASAYFGFWSSPAGHIWMLRSAILRSSHDRSSAQACRCQPCQLKPAISTSHSSAGHCSSAYRIPKYPVLGITRRSARWDGSSPSSRHPASYSETGNIATIFPAPPNMLIEAQVHSSRLPLIRPRGFAFRAYFSTAIGWERG